MFRLRQEILKEVLSYLEKKGVPLTKIVIQKALYFLKATGQPVGYSFEPYAYGPFSVEVAEDLNDLCFWNELEEKDSYLYVFKNFKEPKIEQQLKKKIKDKLDKYVDLLDKNFDFRNVELLGTVIYCCKALKLSGDPLTPENVIEEVKAWKGNKYSKKEILTVFNKIKTLIN